MTSPAATISPRRLVFGFLALAVALGSLGPTGTAHAQQVPGGTIMFPSDQFTVPDARQLTGLRVDLPLPDCDELPSRCNEIELLNELDGFDLEPRITIQLDAAPDGDLEALLTEDNLRLEPVAGGDAVPLGRFVFDPETRLLYAVPDQLLAEDTEYRIVYAGAGEDVTFTTMSATRVLAQMRGQLDDGSAYDAAGIADGQRGIDFEQDGTRTVFDSADVVEIVRYDQRTTDCSDLTAETVLDTEITGSSLYAFGSFLSPSWLDAARTIPQQPTATGEPAVTGSERVGVTLIVPAGTPPEGGWPVAIFGPGITRSKYDLFLAADLNAAQGLATFAIDPVGHAYGECSEVGVTTLSSGGSETRFLGFGRGFDQDGDGEITNQEGVSAPSQPHPKAPVALRDGLRQTAADVMALVRAIARGVDVDGDGTTDLSTSDINLYAQSLGGIYGTMVTGVDPMLETSVLNVPGGPIVEIARLSPVFRDEVRKSLEAREPCLLNGGVNLFDESLPLLLDPAVTEPAEGAIAIQEALARTNWIDRSGSPETFVPLLRERPLADVGERTFLYQFAYGDETVPNPTSATMVRAGDVADLVAFYRNDRTATADSNPHGFLLDPRIQGRNQAQQQVVDFILSDGETILDPDGGGNTWEVPIADPATLETLNFSEDLYTEPEPAPEGCGLAAASASPPGSGDQQAAPTDDDMPATGGGLALVGLALLGVAATAGRGRRRRPVR